MTYTVTTSLKESVLYTFHLQNNRSVIHTVTLFIFVCLTVGNLSCNLNGPEEETAGSRMYRITSASFQKSDGEILSVELEDLYGGTDKVFLRIANAGGRACFYLVHDDCYSEMNMVEKTENRFVSDEITDNSYTWMFSLGQKNDSLQIFFKSRSPVMTKSSVEGHFNFNVTGVEVDNMTADYDWPGDVCSLSDSLTVILDYNGE